MRYIILIIAFLFGGTVSAQISQENIDKVQTKFAEAKKDIVLKQILLDDNQKEIFWSLYDSYEQKRKKIGVERLNVVMYNNSNQLVFNDDDIEDVVDRFIDVKDDTNKLIKNYYKKINRKLGAKVAVKFYMIEVYFQDIVRDNYKKQIPFFNELNSEYYN